jgi:hypothetical protein
MPQREIRLTNSQTQVMEGTARSTLPWLEVTPDKFACPPGQDIALTVRLTREATKLKTKTYDVADAVIIESGGKKHLVNARLVIAMGMRTIFVPGQADAASPLQPADEQPQSSEVIEKALVVKPALIDFGAVSDWSGSLAMRDIEVRNGLAADWSGTAHSTVPWLEVTPADITCPTGAKVTLQARLTSQGSHLRPRTYSAADAIVIEGSGQRLLVEARLTVGRA